MRDEDIDWRCYTALSRGSGSATLTELAAAAGVSEETAALSVSRLEHALLAERKEDRVRLLSVQESLLLCQLRYAPDCPFEIVDGVIRARRSDDA
jgi:hypothetical protein